VNFLGAQCAPEMVTKGHEGQDRRAFLRGIAAGILGCGGGGLIHISSHAMSSPIPPPREGMRGQVVVLRDREMVRGDGAPRPDIILGCMTKALERLTGAQGPEAWRTLFQPGDRVAIKVNALGGPGIATRPEVAAAIAAGIQTAGVDPAQILIWDRSTDELRKAGFGIHEGGSGPMCFGTDRTGYEPLPSVHGSIGSCFSRILTRWATSLVVVPVLKDHDLSGVSLSMKNLFGLIHNPNKYHDSGCSPYLADLLGHPEVQKRMRLVVCDGLRAQCHGGPSHAPKWSWSYCGLLVGTDPVAVDRTGAEILEERRRQLGLPSLQEEGRPPVHITAAQEKGLGEGRRGAIVIHEMGG
jgi:uncharacterized protein (DUF362 family)